MEKSKYKRKKEVVLNHGMIPSQDIEVEETVIGAVLIEKQAIFTVRNILTEKSFYKEAHSKIYQACLELDNDSIPVDIMTVVNKLKTKGELDEIGGAYFVTQLTNRTSSAANIEYHAMILKQHEIKRNHVTFGAEVLAHGYDPTIDIMDTMELISEKASEMMKIIEPKKQKDNIELIRAVIHQMENAKRSDGIIGIKTGFKVQDSLTGGLQVGDLFYIAARPSMGKTAFVLNVARNVAVDEEKDVAIFSLETPGEKIMSRMLSNETGIEFGKLQKGDLDANDLQRFHQKMNPLQTEKLHIFDNMKSIHSIKSKCIELKMEGKLDVVVIDYLQLIEFPQFRNNREREVSEISRTLKLLAMEMNIPIICLSQLSRKVEERTNKKPQLSDLRDSGSIEQDADIVMFLFRPSYYNMPNSPSNLALGIIAKNRNGELKTVEYNFQGSLMRFEDYKNGSNQFPTNDEPPF
jgi:replicative DNA helicase